MKAALYARVSTVAQGEEEKASIPEQIAKIEQHCRDKGYAIADRYIDIGYSGATKSRPEFQRLLKDAQANKFEVIICWKADRLSRGMHPAAALMEIIEPMSIRLEAVEEPLDMNYFAMLAVVGKIELDNIRARTKFGREARAKRGLHPGGHFVPYGYRLNNGKIVLVEEEAHWIKNLFHWVADGKSARSWVAYANKHGFVTQGGQGVLAQQVSQWLRNPIYKGEYVWNKTTMKSGKRKKVPPTEWIEIDCEPIVSAELWEKVQERLSQNKRFSSGNAKQFYLLRGLLTCAECGKSFLGGSGHGRYYECYGTRNYPHLYQCRHPYRINADLLEKYCWNQIIDEVTNIISHQDALQYLINQFEVQRIKLRDDLTNQFKQKEKLVIERQRIATLVRKGHLSPKEAELQYAAIRAEDEQYEAEIAKLEQINANGDKEQAEELLRRIKWLEKVYNWFELSFSQVSNEDKCRVVQDIIDKVIIDGENQVEVRLKLLSPDWMKSLVSLYRYDTTCRTTRL